MFVEQPLASPGSFNNLKLRHTRFWLGIHEGCCFQRERENKQLVAPNCPYLFILTAVLLSQMFQLLRKLKAVSRILIWFLSYCLFVGSNFKWTSPFLLDFRRSRIILFNSYLNKDPEEDSIFLHNCFLIWPLSRLWNILQ